MAPNIAEQALMRTQVDSDDEPLSAVAVAQICLDNPELAAFEIHSGRIGPSDERVPASSRVQMLRATIHRAVAWVRDQPRIHEGGHSTGPSGVLFQHQWLRRKGLHT